MSATEFPCTMLQTYWRHVAESMKLFVLCSLLQDNAAVTGGKKLKSLITDMNSRGP